MMTRFNRVNVAALALIMVLISPFTAYGQKDPTSLKEPQGAEQKDEKTQDLCEYAQKGDIKALEAALHEMSGMEKEKRLALINKCGDRGRTPLELAAREGHSSCVTLLIKAGATIDAQDDFYQTPMHLAALNGHSDCVTLLIKAGAAIDTQDQFGRTPLHRAAYSINSYITYSQGRDCIRLLVEYGADHTIPNYTNETPEQIVYDCPVESFKQLVQEGLTLRKVREKAQLKALALALEYNKDMPMDVILIMNGYVGMYLGDITHCTSPS